MAALSLPRKTKLAVMTFLSEILDESDDDESTKLDSAATGAAILHAGEARARRPRNRQYGYIEEVVNSFRPDEFKIFFRIAYASFESLYNWICRIAMEENIPGISQRQGSGGTPQKPLKDRLLMTLWFLGSKDKYSSIADRFGVSESTANVAIRCLLNFIADHLLDRLITWPTADEQREITDMYAELKNFPGVVGMIDGTHIPIQRPAERGTDYFNRKDFYSVVLQAVCREDLRFTNVYAGWPGKVHDARVFRQSPLYQTGAQLCGDGHILADSAYPNLSWVLVPFRDNGHLTPNQREYNAVHASIRNTVERAFGLLKGRFPRLRHVHQRDIQTIVTTIISACVLHNICILNEDFSEEMLDEGVPQQIPEPGIFDPVGQEHGARKRLAIARRLN